MESWQSIFLEREQELQQLTSLWKLAKTGQPQLAVINAHPGLGKTRLVQEFYHKLSTEEDASGATGYWPDRLSRERDALRLSPQPADCIDKNGLPYLWWGFKLVDQGSNSAGTSGLYEATDLYLNPHLAAMRRAALLHDVVQEKSRQTTEGAKEVAKEVAKGSAEAGIGLIPVIGPAITTIFSVFNKLRQRRQKIRSLEEQEVSLAEPVSAGAESSQSLQAFEDEILRSLRDYINTGRSDTAPPRHPVVIVIDDAQFSTQDAAASSLMLRLLKEAWAEKWPILLLLTYWPDRWHSEVAQKKGFPGAVDSKSSLTSEECNWTEVKLQPLTSLQTLVSDALPGLPNDQQRQLLERANGNPRYLERLLQLLIQSPALFVDRATNNALTTEALESILDEKFDLHQVTLKLIQSADAETQQALALSGLIGNRFRCELITELGDALALEDMHQGLLKGERPLHILSGVNTGIAEFQQGAFQSVAKTLVPRVIGPVAQIELTLETLYKNILDDWDMVLRETGEAEQMIANLINRYDPENATKSQQLLRGRSLLRMLEILTKRDDLASAENIYNDWLIGIECSNWVPTDFKVEERFVIFFFFYQKEDYNAASSVSAQIIEDQTKALSDSNNAANLLQISNAHWIACHYYTQRKDLGTAMEHADNCLRYARLSKDETQQDKVDIRLCEGLQQKGFLVNAIDGVEESMPYCQEALSIARTLDERINNAISKNNLIARVFELAVANNLLAGPAESVALIDEQLSLTRELADNHPIGATKQKLVDSLFHKAKNCQAVDGYSAAQIYFEEAQQRASALYEENGDRESMMLLATSLANLSANYQNIGRLEDAKAAALESVSIRRVIESEVDSIMTKLMLCDSLHILAMTQQALDGAPAAVPAYSEALELAEEVYSRLRTSGNLLTLCNTLKARALCLLDAKLLEEAQTDQQRFLELVRNEHKELNTLASKIELTNTIIGAVPLVEKISGVSQACDLAKEGVTLAREIHTIENSRNSLHNLCHAISSQADMVIRSDTLSAALPLHEELLAFRRQAVQSENTATASQLLVNALIEYGDVKYQLDDRLSASDFYHEAREIVERLYKDQPTPAIGRLVVFSTNREEVVQRELYGPIAALDTCEKSTDTLRALYSQSPSIKTLSDLAGGIGRLVTLKEQAKGPAASLKLATEATDLWQQVQQLDSSHIASSNLHNSLYSQAFLIEKLNGPKAAAKLLEHCVNEQQNLHKIYNNIDTTLSYGNSLYQQARLNASIYGARKAESNFKELYDLMEKANSVEPSERLAIQLCLAAFHMAANRIKFDDSDTALALLEKGLQTLRDAYARHPSNRLLSQSNNILCNWLDVAVESRSESLIKTYIKEIDEVSRQYLVESGTDESKKQLAFALARISKAVLATDGAHAAKAVGEEYCQLIEDTDNNNWRSYEAAKNRSVALSEMGKIQRHILGPGYAVDLFEKSNLLMIADETSAKSIELERQFGYGIHYSLEANHSIHGPRASLAHIADRLNYCRDFYNKEESRTSLRDILAVTLIAARANIQIEDYDKGDHFIEESEQLIKQLGEKTFDDIGLWKITGRRDCLTLRYTAALKWRAAFTEEVTTKEEALMFLDSQQELVKGIDQHFEHSNTVKHAYFAMQPLAFLSFLQLIAEQSDQSKTSLQRYHECAELVELKSTFESRKTASSIAWLYPALVMIKTEQYQEAQTVLSNGIDSMKKQLVHSPYETLRPLAMAHWLLAKVQMKSGDDAAAQAALSEGVAYAEAFAKYKTCDGELIVKAYQEALN